MSPGSRGALALAAGAIVLGLVLRDKKASPASAGSGVSEEAATVVSATSPVSFETSALADPAAVPSDLPRALADTTPDGELHTDGGGHFRVDADAKRFFDYFLLAEGEESDATVRERVASALAARLRDPARAEGLATYDRYLGFRQRAAVTRFADHEPAARIAEVRRLRRDLFGRDAGAFFAREEALEDRMLQQLAAKAEGRELPAVLDARGSESSAAVAQLIARDGAWKSLSPEERLAERSKAFGPEIAARLAKMDQESEAWHKRLDAYFEARQQILDDTESLASTRERRLETLREGFSEAERTRLPALERIHDRKAATTRP
jgi:lipase chaperone LimK